MEIWHNLEQQIWMSDLFSGLIFSFLRRETWRKGLTWNTFFRFRGVKAKYVTVHPRTLSGQTRRTTVRIYPSHVCASHPSTTRARERSSFLLPPLPLPHVGSRPRPISTVRSRADGGGAPGGRPRSPGGRWRRRRRRGGVRGGGGAPERGVGAADARVPGGGLRLRPRPAPKGRALLHPFQNFFPSRPFGSSLSPFR